MKKKISIVFIVLISCFFVLYFLKKDTKFEYNTQKPYFGGIVDSIIATGTVQAQNLVDVGAEVTGQIKILHVKLGDRVKKGDIIVEIDATKQENELKKQQSQLEIYQADFNAAQIAYDIALSKLKREEKLFALKATSMENLDNAREDCSLKLAKTKQLQAQINQAKITLNSAQKDLNNTKIVSPLDGVIVSLPTKQGQTINSNQTTPVVARVADLSKMEINLEVSEADIPRIKVGMPVFYKILAFDNIKKKAYIASIDPALKSLSSSTSTSSNLTSDSSSAAVYYGVKILVDNSDDFLKIGMTTENTIIISEAKDTIYVPTTAIFDEDGKKFINILKDNKSIKTEIITGISDAINTQVISGIEKDDDIILSSSSDKFAKKNVRVRM